MVFTLIVLFFVLVFVIVVVGYRALNGKDVNGRRR
jgi:hypothetical protein